MLEVIALFGNVTEKNRIVVSFMDAEKTNLEVVRAVVTNDESITSLALLAKKKFDELGKEFKIQKILNGHRYSTRQSKIVTTDPVLQTTIDKVVSTLVDEVPA